MTPDPLPPELLALERELAARAKQTPPAELRSRVLSAVVESLPGLQRKESRIRLGGFAAATAAAMLLAINLSASVANNVEWRSPTSTSGADVTELAAQIHGLDPDLTDREALCQAIVLHSATDLILIPAPAAPVDRIASNEELNRWDKH